MELEELLSAEFRKHKLFKRALTHRSAARDHNERLEFLGDSVLQLMISNYLYNCFSGAAEGQLTQMRSRLVRKETLSNIAEKLNLRKWLRLGPGERSGKLSDSVMADAMEAVIGALYLQEGLRATWHFINQIYKEQFEYLADIDDFSDAKTRLQEWMQGQGYPLPLYRVTQNTESGFEVECETQVGKATGWGKAKRNAEQEAARSLLIKLKSED